MANLPTTGTTLSSILHSLSLSPLSFSAGKRSHQTRGRVSVNLSLDVLKIWSLFLEKPASGCLFKDVKRTTPRNGPDLLSTWETNMNQPPWRPRSWMEQWGGWKCCPAGYLWKGSKLLMICTIPRLLPWLHAKTCKKHRKSLRRTRIYVNWWLNSTFNSDPKKETRSN